MKIGDTVKVRNEVLVSYKELAKVIKIVPDDESDSDMVLVKFVKPNVAVSSSENKQWFMEEDLKTVNKEIS